MSSLHQKLRGCGTVVATVALAFGLAFSAQAAPPVGTVQGVARDEQQHTEAGVTLRLEANGKEVARTTTAADGSFSFTGVAPGTYTIAAEKSGLGKGSADITVAADAGVSADVTLLAAAQQPTEEVTVTAQRLAAAELSIEPQIGASTYSLSSQAIQQLPGGEDLPLNQVLLQTPGVNQDNQANGAIHIRNEHLEVQYRINGIVLPEGVSFFGQGLDPRFIDSMQLITGTLPAEYGLRVAGVLDMETKSGLTPGGAVEMRGGSYGTINPSFQYGGSVSGYNFYFSGDNLESNHGIDSVTEKYNQIHDETIQSHGFVYLDKIIDSASKIAFIGGTFQGQFQIPNNPGQVPVFGPNFIAGSTIAGETNYNSADLTEHQVEGSSFGALSYLRSEQDFDFQVSAFTKYSTLQYHPDALGDLFFNGISQDALRQSFANGVQTDASYDLNENHTLRAGTFLQGEKAWSDTNSTVLVCDSLASSYLAGCPGSAPSPSPFAIVQNQEKTGWLYSAYLQDEWKALPNFTVNYGGRFDVVNEYTMDNQISPRLNTVWKPLDGTTVHAGYANYLTPPPFELVSTATVNNPVLLNSSGSCMAGPGPSNTGTCLNSPVKSERSHVFDVGIEQEILPGLKVGIDAFYKYARNLLDEGQFGAPVILTPFNYHVGYNKGVEISTSYDHGNFSSYANLQIGEEKAEGVTSAQFNFTGVPGNGCPESQIVYADTHLVNTDHSQLSTASVGASYNWIGTRFSADMIAGSGLRTMNPGDCFNEGTVPSYVQINLGVSHKFDLPEGGPIDVGIELVNLTDEVYLIRSQTGVGVFAPAYGPRRSVYATVRKEF